MSTEAASPLRRRMIEDMTIRQFGEHTKRDYVRQVRQFAAFLWRARPIWLSPKTSGATSFTWPRVGRVPAR